MAKSLLENYLPKSFSHEIVKCNSESELKSAELRVNIKSSEDVEKWREEFGRLSGTNWVVQKTFPNMSRREYKKSFVCRRSSKNHLSRDLDSRHHK